MPQSESSSVLCPRDRAPLIDFTAYGRRQHGCVACKGMWIDRDILMRFADCDPAELEDRLARMPASVPAMACPLDGQSLRSGRFNEVQVDVCRACFGAWLDRGELEKLKSSRRKHSKDGSFWDDLEDLLSSDYGDY